VTEEEMKFFRKRQLEVHEEVARDRQLYADLNLARAIRYGRALKQ
jgi:hypothetical protein